MFSLRSPNMDGPYALTYPQLRRTLPLSPCVSDFPRFPSLPPPLPALPPSPPRSNLPSHFYHYPISLPSTTPPSIPPVNPDTLGLGLSFNDDADLQARLWALEQQDDPALLQLQYDDDSDDESDYDYDYDDYDDEVQDQHHDRWRGRFERRVRKLLSLRVRVRVVWRKFSF